MLTNNDIKRIKSLSQSKFRQKYKKFVAEGDKICFELLSSNKFSIEAVYHLADWQPQESLLQGIHTELVDNKTMGRVSSLVSPPPVLMVCDMTPRSWTQDEDIKRYALYLDRIQNPGNVGTILRIADWYGIDTVIRNEGTADFYHPKVVQASMGSLGAVTLLTDTDDKIRNTSLPTYGAFLDGQDITDTEWSTRGIIVMGNEGKGISEDIAPSIHRRINIAGSTSRRAESLNVGIATGILCHEWFSSTKIQ